jgi:hypothetical protein
LSIFRFYILSISFIIEDPIQKTSEISCHNGLSPSIRTRKMRSPPRSYPTDVEGVALAKGKKDKKSKSSKPKKKRKSESGIQESSNTKKLKYKSKSKSDRKESSASDSRSDASDGEFEWVEKKVTPNVPPLHREDWMLQSNASQNKEDVLGDLLCPREPEMPSSEAPKPKGDFDVHTKLVDLASSSTHDSNISL